MQQAPWHLSAYSTPLRDENDISGEDFQRTSNSDSMAPLAVFVGNENTGNRDSEWQYSQCRTQ